jgi:hypothetical protein
MTYFQRIFLNFSFVCCPSFCGLDALSLASAAPAPSTLSFAPAAPPLRPRRFMSRLSLLLPRQPLRPLPSLRRYFLPRLPIGISPSALDFGLSKRERLLLQLLSADEQGHLRAPTLELSSSLC